MQRAERKNIGPINPENPPTPKITYKQHQTRHIKGNNHTINHTLHENIQILTQKTARQQHTQRHRKRTRQIRDMQTRPRTHHGKQTRTPTKQPKQENPQRATSIQHKHQRKKNLLTQLTLTRQHTDNQNDIQRQKQRLNTRISHQNNHGSLLHKKARHTPIRTSIKKNRQRATTPTTQKPRKVDNGG